MNGSRRVRRPRSVATLETPPEPLLLRVRQAAELMQVATSTLYALIASSAVPYVKLGGSIRIPRAQLIRFIEQNTSGPPHPPHSVEPTTSGEFDDAVRTTLRRAIAESSIADEYERE